MRKQLCGLGRAGVVLGFRDRLHQRAGITNQCQFFGLKQRLQAGVGLIGGTVYGGAAVFSTNAVYAYVRAISGNATEKAPQNNADVRGDAFAYRIVVETLPVGWIDNAGILTSASDRVLTKNLADVRLLCRWPLKEAFASSPPSDLSRPAVGNSRMTFRTQVSGLIVQQGNNSFPGVSFYFAQPKYYAP